MTKHSIKIKHSPNIKIFTTPLFSINLCNSVSWGGGDTTLVVPIGSHQDVSVITPSGTPRVFDSEVVLSRQVTVSDSGDGVVQSGRTASRTDVNSTRVKLESNSTSINSNTNSTNLSQSRGQFRFRVFGGSTTVGDRSDRVGGIGDAVSGFLVDPETYG